MRIEGSRAGAGMEKGVRVEREILRGVDGVEEWY